MDTTKKEVDKQSIISGLEYLLNESKIASAKIEFSYELDRMKRRITELEEENIKIKDLLKVIYIKLTDEK